MKYEDFNKPIRGKINKDKLVIVIVILVMVFIPYKFGMDVFKKIILGIIILLLARPCVNLICGLVHMRRDLKD